MSIDLDNKLAKTLKLDQSLRFWAVFVLIVMGVLLLFAQLFFSKPTVMNITNVNYYGSNIVNPQSQ